MHSKYFLTRIFLPLWLAGLSLSACLSGDDGQGSAQVRGQSAGRLSSLETLSVDALRVRSYYSHPEVVANLADSALAAVYRQRFLQGEAGYDSLLLAYNSDGLRVYSRMDIPAEPPPPGGYPVLVFVQGWYGREAAPGFDFMYRP